MSGISRYVDELALSYLQQEKSITIEQHNLLHDTTQQNDKQENKNAS